MGAVSNSRVCSTVALFTSFNRSYILLYIFQKVLYLLMKFICHFEVRFERLLAILFRHNRMLLAATTNNINTSNTLSA